MRGPISQQNWAEYFFVNPDITKARTLHRYAFTDPSFAADELEKVFDRSWLLVPQRPADEIARGAPSLTKAVGAAGRNIVIPFLGENLHIWRDSPPKNQQMKGLGNLYCTSNVCSHFWFPISEGMGQSKTQICGQHGRKFNCQGRCLGQPGFSREQMEDGSADVKQFNIAEWEQLIFVNMDGPLAPFEEVFDAVRHTTSCMPLADLTRVPHRDEVRTRPGNWKLWIMNFLDASHIGFLHAGEGSLSKLIDPDRDSYRMRLFPEEDIYMGHSCLQWAYAGSPELGFDPDWLPPEFYHPKKRVLAIYWYLFPSTVLMFFPWGMASYSFVPDLDNPRATRYYWYQYVWDESFIEKKDAVWLHTRVNQEDELAMSLVAANMNSRFIQRGKFSPENDKMIHWFQHSISTMISRHGIEDI